MAHEVAADLLRGANIYVDADERQIGSNFKLHSDSRRSNFPSGIRQFLRLERADEVRFNRNL